MTTFPTKNEMRRFFMGPYVAHMTDEQMERYMEPYERAADDVLALAFNRSMPAWWCRLVREERGNLLRVLRARAGMDR